MKRLATLGVLLSLSPAAVSWSAPQTQEIQQGWVWHLVRDGETLQTITVSYLGDARRWQENWRLNPQLSDPHKIAPGQRIRVLVGPAAQIERVARRVDEKRPRQRWQPTRVGARLSQGDGLRTHQQSSAEIAFEDRSRVLITENSLLFLRSVNPRADRTEPRSIEIRVGQADLALPRATEERREIEILIAGAKVTASSSQDAPGRSRSRLASGRRAQVMVYEGNNTVEAGGAELDVPPGMGTTTSDAGRLGELEELLPPPGNTRPEEDALLPHANPVFEWRSVTGAASYVVEVCRDPDCGELVARQTDVSQTEWQPRGLPMGQLYWCVSAVSASGLDGYASPSQSMLIESLWRRRRIERR